MEWIENHQKYDGEKIPEQLFYDGYQTDKNKYNETPLILWITYRTNKPIPEELYYEGCQTDKSYEGYTPLMLWIICHDYIPG